MMVGGVAGEVGRLAVWPSGRLAVWPSGRLAVWPATVSWVLLNSCLCRTSRLNVGDSQPAHRTNPLLRCRVASSYRRWRHESRRDPAHTAVVVADADFHHARLSCNERSRCSAAARPGSGPGTASPARPLALGCH